jgi:hypothetical protein
LPAKTPVSDAMVSRNNMRFMDAVAPCAGDAQIVVFISFRDRTKTSKSGWDANLVGMKE